MKAFSTIFIFAMWIGQFNELKAQCMIQSTDQSQGYITYYLEPELIAQTEDLGMALSVQSISDNFYLALTYRFGGMAVPLEEKVGIELENGYMLELGMYTIQVGNAAGVELAMAVYEMPVEVLPYFRQSDMKAVHFRTQEGEEHHMPVTSNKDALKRQLRCFGK